MAKLGKTWWGQRFIEALEGFTDSGRLQRGRAYRGDSRILDFDIADGTVTATVWDKDGSFIEVMEELYLRVRVKNKDAL